MRMATTLIKSFLSTKKALGFLVFLSVCLAFQGFAVTLFDQRIQGEYYYNDWESRSTAPEVNVHRFQEEKAESLEYVRRLKSTRRTLKFFHIPKAAGTAIEHVAGDQMRLPWGSCLFNHKPKRTICNYPPSDFEWPRNYGWWHLPAQLFPVAGADPYAGAELFAVIRDPFDRLVSEFYYICSLKVFNWRPDQCDRNRLFEPEYMNEWLQNKLSHKNFSQAETYLQDNGHFTPQYDFLVSKHQVRMVDYVLRMEDLPEQFQSLMDAFRLNIRMAKQKMNVARNSTTHLDIHHLDHATVSSVQKVFPHDFDLSPVYKQTPWKAERE